ncbi:hypothetical protein [Sphingobacterium griseoflavum]|uniref:Uncharacterized protein n=1 Tax=Sphingobacterium griseoflavum TaxID=1474952 RepID=A0ABQ3HW08_9SPHI|nr:hypothetical protein [Sphingobacterium griseoflavum]GHE29982.1 hypothetical protein GCM10017764_11330 [Sphingobacterium griseoflavum]
MIVEKHKIENFIRALERLLATNFQRKIDADIIMLHAPKHELSIILYLPTAMGRLAQQSPRTVHIDYDQIISDSDKLCGRLAALFGNGQVVYARKTVVARIDKRVSISFLEEHHLQAAIPGKYRYGLFHEGQLVSIAIFSGGRRMRDQHEKYRSFELIRFCHKTNFRIVGGLSKLLQAFIKDFRPDDIMTYVDRDWSHDSNLATLGFKEVGTAGPQRYAVANGIRRPVESHSSSGELPVAIAGCYYVENSGSTKLLLRL